MDSKKRKRLSSIAHYCIALAVILSLILLFIFLFSGRDPGDIEIFAGGKTIGLRCVDSEILHPALRDYAPVSHANTIMANFTDDELSSITLYYVGTYNSSLEAKQAEAYAQADYGLILAKEYGVNVGSFSHSFMIDGERVSMTITAKDGNIDDKTASYFLLEQNKSFPKSLDEVKRRYEERNFSYEVID